MQTILSIYKNTCSKFKLDPKPLGKEAFTQLSKLCQSLKLVDIDRTGLVTDNQAISRLCKSLLSVSEKNINIPRLAGDNRNRQHSLDTEENNNNQLCSTTQERAGVLRNYFKKKDK
jgi:hypothetical protein